MKRDLLGWIALAAVVVGLVGFRIHRVREREASAGGPPFTLTDARTGQPFTDQTLLGTPTALFFGFTACPDVCPTTLATATRWLAALGPDGARLRFAFVTVDPERDTVERMKQYVTAFDPRIVGLVGTRAETDRVIARFGVFANKVPHADTYTYDHTALVLMVDARGVSVGTVDHDESDEVVLGKLRGLIAR